jgi:hypothetical protein
VADGKRNRGFAPTPGGRMQRILLLWGGRWRREGWCAKAKRGVWFFGFIEGLCGSACRGSLGVRSGAGGLPDNLHSVLARPLAAPHSSEDERPRRSSLAGLLGRSRVILPSGTPSLKTHSSRKQVQTQDQHPAEKEYLVPRDEWIGTERSVDRRHRHDALPFPCHRTHS